MNKILLILFILINILYAKDITVTGYGTSKDEALRSAFQNAVEQEVGVLVDTKTVIRNNKLIKNDILTYSNGFIKDYKEISSSQQMGFWEIKIKAKVEHQKLLLKLKKINLKPTNIEDTDKLYAQIISQVKTKFDAEDLFKKIYEDYTFLPTSLYGLKIVEFNVDTDLATRTSVPVSIKVQVIKKEPSAELKQKVKYLYDLISKLSIGSYPYEVGSYHKHFQNEIIVSSFNHPDTVFGFPRSYSVIYPFAKSKPRTVRRGNWYKYKYASFGRVKQVINGNAMVSILDKNGNSLKTWSNVFEEYNRKKEQTAIFWLSSMISKNRVGPKLMILKKTGNTHCFQAHECMLGYLWNGGSFNYSFARSPLERNFRPYPRNDIDKDIVTLKWDMPIKYLKEIKQVKGEIRWRSHRPWKFKNGTTIYGDGKMI